MIKHKPVLLQESIEGLAIKKNGIYVDGTFGYGGHSHAILQKLSATGRLLAIDKDSKAIEHAKQYFCQDNRFQIFQGSFARLAEFVSEANSYGQIDGILLDLGVSSPQLDDSERGFSFMQCGPLDMRMDLTQELDAAHYINHAEFDDMVAVFQNYGEERFARRIAKAIIDARIKSPIITTTVLADIVKAANPKWEKHKHPATRVFQAIRIHINQELPDLTVCLESAVDVLAIGGRLAVISFHSLEDRIVKQFMRRQEKGEILPRNVPVRTSDIKANFKRIGKAVKPCTEEVKYNIRSRSAILRIGEKIA